jgi:acyl carrier protein
MAQPHDQHEDADTASSRAEADAKVVRVVMRILRDTLHMEVDDESVDLIDGGLLDSLALVELLLELERVLRIRLVLDELDVDDLRNVEHIARFVNTWAAKDPRLSG